MSTRWLLVAIAQRRALLCFAIGHVSPHGRIIAAELETVRVILAILQCDIGVAALGAAQLDNDTIALLACHEAFLNIADWGVDAHRSAYKPNVIVAANS